MQTTWAIVVVVLVAMHAAVGGVTYEGGSGAPSTVDGCTGRLNEEPIITTAPALVRTVPNGKLYRVPVDSKSPDLNVVHLWGTPYEKGLAQGQLLKADIETMFTQLPEWIESQADQYIQFLPADFRKLVEQIGMWAALEFEILATRTYTPQNFLDEIRGVAEGAGIEESLVHRVVLFPSLIQAACSMYGAWGTAVANTTGSMYQLRALDWNADSPLQQWPTVQVYHNEADEGNSYAQLGWAGFVGAITGFSEAPLGVCEKVWIEYKGEKTRFGEPFHFVLRDLLQHTSTIDEALSYITNAKRTCSIYVGLGDASNTFTAVRYAPENVTFWDHDSMPSWPGHPTIEDVVYIDKHVQPSHNPCLGNLLQDAFGNIDAETTIRQVAPQLETGDMHAAVFDFTHRHMYVANASPVVNGTVIPAYYRPFIRLDMVSLFQEAKPDAE